MDLAAILALGGLALFEHGTAHSIARQQEYLAIAEKVAGTGKPHCTLHHADGSVTTCRPRFSVRHSRQVNAWTFGGHIHFSSAAINRLSPDQFALLAGHEIAHYYLGHSHSSISSELAADALGAVLACRAGYRLEQATGLFQFARSSRSHPAPVQRREILYVLAQGQDCNPQKTQFPSATLTLNILM